MSIIGNPLLANDERLKNALNRITSEEEKYFEGDESLTDKSDMESIKFN